MSTPLPPAPDTFDQALLDYDAQHGVRPGPAAPAPAAARPASGAARAAAVVGGLLLTLLVTAITFGTALLGFLGMGVAALVRRGRPFTRGAGFLGALAGPTIGLVLLLGGGAAAAAGSGKFSLAEVQRAMQQASKQPHRETAVDSAYARVAPEAKAASEAQAQAMVDVMARHPGALVGLAIFGVLFACGIYGGLIGAMAWGSATVLLYGVTGRWPAAGRASGVLKTPPAARRRDAFDAI